MGSAMKSVPRTPHARRIRTLLLVAVAHAAACSTTCPAGYERRGDVCTPAGKDAGADNGTAANPSSIPPAGNAGPTPAGNGGAPAAGTGGGTAAPMTSQRRRGAGGTIAP